MIAVAQQAQTAASIVGGGPADAALGALLAQNRRAVEILEQSSATHDKVCGEFLSSEAVAYLDRLGLNPGSMGAVRINAIRLATRTCLAGVSCRSPLWR